MEDHQPEVLSERTGAVLRLTINRPRAANAINGAVAGGIVAGLADASRDDDVRAVILTGAGDRAFSAGRDLKNPERLSAEALDAQRRTELRGYTEALLAFEKPLVVAMNGAALGAGLMLALHADQIVASDLAVVALPEIDIGIATFLGHALVAGVAGEGLANDMVLTGRRLSAAEALQRGLVHAVVPAASLGKESEARAALLGQKQSETFRAAKSWILRRRRAAVEAAFGAHEARERRRSGTIGFIGSGPT